MIRKLLTQNEVVKRKLTLTTSLTFDQANKTLTYKSPLFNLVQKVEGEKLVLTHQKGIGQEQTHDVYPAGLAPEYYAELQQGLYELTLRSKNLSTLQATVPLAMTSQKEVRIPPSEESSVRLMIQEKFFNQNKDDSNSWIYAPVKIVSYPVQKIMYDVPGMITGSVSESVVRSPWHNLLGSKDEFKGAGKLFWNGVKDVARGILNPAKATSLDGAIEVIDTTMKISRGVLGVGKAGVSLIGYPLYRIGGGKRSQYVPLRGKRAAIVIVDTGVAPIFDNIIDTYGESIVRSQLKSISDYYCVSSNAEPNSINNCIERIPDDIPYLDLIALTHSGGTSKIDYYAKKAAEEKGIRPELMISIGCYDPASKLTDKENTVGQKGLSWAVHFYLSNMLSKRLRGIPLEDAANQAFFEGIATNSINPVSWGGMAAVGYKGSTPNSLTDDMIVAQVLSEGWHKVTQAVSVTRFERVKNVFLLEEHLQKLEEFHAKVEANKSAASFSQETEKKLADSLKKLSELKIVVATLKANSDDSSTQDLLDKAYYFANL